MAKKDKGSIEITLRGHKLLLHPDNTVTDSNPFEQLGREPIKLSDAVAASVRKAAEEGTDLARAFSSPWNGGVTERPKETLDKNVNHPSRYTRGDIECIDALESAVVGKSPVEAIYVANVIKYLWRYEEKEPVRSLLSAKWYLDRLIEKAKEKYGEPK